jgi:UDP-N-acetylmuramate dehydrogenase
VQDEPYDFLQSICLMMWPTPDWMDALPKLANGYGQNEPLAAHTTMRIGGPAQVWAEPQNWDEVAQLTAFCHAQGIPLTWVGKGSNLMVRDGGLKGVAAHLAKGTDKIEVNGNRIYAEAGAASGSVARAAREAGLGGIAFLCGIPGAIGGALRMNAGAYGGETFENLKRVWFVTETGETVEKEASFCKPRYRGTEIPEGWMYKAAEWELTPQDKNEILAKMQEINRARSTTQPLSMPSSGSWFKNVIVTNDNIDSLLKKNLQVKHGDKLNAWKVVDAAGCRGHRVGGAQVSTVHCNFFVNIGAVNGEGAKAADFESLSQFVEAQVQAKVGVALEREVRWVGEDDSES